MYLSPQKAQQIILNHAPILSSERINFLDSFGRTLAEDIKATCDLPSFDRSSMDGAAVRSADTLGANLGNPVTLKVVGTIAAGRVPRRVIQKGEAMKIMTGAIIPKGVDSVLPKEQFLSGVIPAKAGIQKRSSWMPASAGMTESDSIHIYAHTHSGDFIRFRGEDVKKGQPILGKGIEITSGVVSLLATLGLSKVAVYRWPRVAILVTGDELVDLKGKLTQGKVRSVNQYSLFTQVQQTGGEPVLLGIAKDVRPQIEKKIQEGLKYDVLLISGGVSVGDFDLVPEVLKKFKFKFFVEKVSIQPGKPLIFAKKGKTFVFGLPGNPVSTMVSFYKFVRPFLLKMSGRKEIFLKKAAAILDEEIKINGQRMKVMRGIVSEAEGKLYVRLTSHQGSGNIISMAKANCLFEIPEGVIKLKKGQLIEIQYLS